MKRTLLEIQMNNDPWLKVLEDRVAELDTKQKRHRAIVDVKVDKFRRWVAEESNVNILYDSELKVSQMAKAKETYTVVWHEYMKALSELEQYKDAMGYE